MSSSIAEKFDQEFTGPVRDGGLFGEADVAADERADANHAGELVERAGQRSNSRQRVDRALPRAELRLFDRAARSYLPDGNQLAVFERQLARDVDQVPHSFRWYIRPGGGGRWRKHDVHRFK